MCHNTLLGQKSLSLSVFQADFTGACPDGFLIGAVKIFAFLELEQN